MAQTIVQGYSDDLVSIEGSIVEEFNAIGGLVDINGEDSDGGILGFSNGMVFRIEYGKTGVWRITPVAIPTELHGNYIIKQAPENNADNYSDCLIIDGDVKWVVFGSRCEVAK